jgi:hypothetical protein
VLERIGTLCQGHRVVHSRILCNLPPRDAA